MVFLSLLIVFHFVMVYTVKGFSIVNETEVDFFFPEFSRFFCHSMDVENLISGSIWKFSVPILLKSILKDFEYYIASM